MSEKILSSFEREMKNSAFKKAFDNSYKEFLITQERIKKAKKKFL